MNEELLKQLAAAFMFRAQRRAEILAADRRVETSKNKLKKTPEALAVAEAKADRRSLLERTNSAEATFEQILAEALTGKTGLPLLDNAPLRQPLLQAKADPQKVADRLADQVAADLAADAKQTAPQAWYETKREDEFELKPSKANGIVTITSGDIDQELAHALARNGGSKIWLRFAIRGATNDDIRETLEKIWPKEAASAKPDKTHTRFGYTFCTDAFWVGERKGPTAKPNLSGQGLLARVRQLMALPTPSEIAKRHAAAAPAVKQKPMVVYVPQGGWSSTSLFSAATELAGSTSVDTAKIVLCKVCQTIEIRGKRAMPVVQELGNRFLCGRYPRRRRRGRETGADPPPQTGNLGSNFAGVI